MKKVRIVLLAVAAAALMTAVAGDAIAGKRATVKLGDNFFKPAKKKVRKGTLVRFKWIGDNPHNVTKKKGPGRNFGSATTSDEGINFKKRFKKRGKYKLICTVHPGMGMTLKVR